MPRFIHSPTHPGQQADSADMLQLFGIKGGKWPDAGCPLRFIQGIAVHVLPKDHVSLQSKPGRKNNKHRVIASCPTCGIAVSAGRLHQHRCDSTRNRARVIQRAMQVDRPLPPMPDVFDAQPLKSLGDDE